VKPGDLVRVTCIRWRDDGSATRALLLGIITKELGKFGVDTWFNVLLDGKIEAVNEAEVEVIDEAR
jgi:hypothetical protein